jgi:hypothetical protein
MENFLSILSIPFFFFFDEFIYSFLKGIKEDKNEKSKNIYLNCKLSLQ